MLAKPKNFGDSKQITLLGWGGGGGVAREHAQIMESRGKSASQTQIMAETAWVRE